MLPDLIKGDKVGALAMTEADTGSDVVGMKLKAEKDGEYGFRLNGHKLWITNAPIADVAIVYAKTRPDLGKNGITSFLLDRSIHPFQRGKRLRKFGMLASDTGELIFDNTPVSKDAILGEENRGIYVLMKGLDYERLVLSAGALGIAQNAMDLALEYSVQRK